MYQTLYSVFRSTNTQTRGLVAVFAEEQQYGVTAINVNQALELEFESMRKVPFDRFGDRLADRFGDRFDGRSGDRLGDRFGDRLDEMNGSRCGVLNSRNTDLLNIRHMDLRKLRNDWLEFRDIYLRDFRNINLLKFWEH